MVDIRQARENEFEAIRALFQSAYGESYTDPGFYDERFLRRLILGESTLMLVAVDPATGDVLGTASVVLESGAFSDLVGEFGRLVVHPDARGRGIGHRLMQGRLERVRDRLHVGFTEARTVHPYSVRIAEKSGFNPVGFLPMKMRFAERRESAAVLVQYFGDALELRRNHPRVVPELDELASAALDSVGLRPDLIVDDTAPTYPPEGSFEIQELTTDGYSDLLRIERGRVRNREVFGRFKLHYGFFRLAASDSKYLIAYDRGRVTGGLGFTYDAVEDNAQVFEIITAHDRAVRQLLDELVERCEQLNVCTIEIDVGAHATSLQRTLVEMGFVPAAYVPAMAFHNVERVDVVRMMRLNRNLCVGEVEIDGPMLDIAQRVLRRFEQQEVAPEVAEYVERIGLLRGLGDEQARRLVTGFTRRTYESGEQIFRPGDPGDEMYVILDGNVAVETGSGRDLARVGPGECLGELALLSATPHSARAIASNSVRAGVLTRQALESLVRERPDIGVVLYRNLARGLVDKLRITNLVLEAPGGVGRR